MDKSINLKAVVPICNERYFGKQIPDSLRICIQRIHKLTGTDTLHIRVSVVLILFVYYNKFSKTNEEEEMGGKEYKVKIDHLTVWFRWCFITLRNNKIASYDDLSVELCKYGVSLLKQRLKQLFNCCWKMLKYVRLESQLS